VGGGLRAGGHEVVIGEETKCAGVLGLGGQSCDQSSCGRLLEFGDRFEVAGALEVVRERVVRGHGFEGLGSGFCGGLEGARRGSGNIVCACQPRASARSFACEGGGCREAAGEPAGPEAWDAAGWAGFEGGRVAIGAEASAGVGGDEPLFEIQEHPAGDASEGGAQGSGWEDSAGVGEVGGAEFPIHHVGAARTEAAQRQVFNFGVAELEHGAFQAHRLCACGGFVRQRGCT
jgi:hypothetical protein